MRSGQQSAQFRPRSDPKDSVSRLDSLSAFTIGFPACMGA